MRKFYALVVAVLSLALCLSVAVAATAATSGHNASHAAKKKKKKKKKSKVVVKCASTLVCKSHPGPTGPAGPQGNPGGPGANGYSIVARARSRAAFAPNECTGSTCPDQPDPLTGGTWTQQPTETDHIVGTLTFTQPATACTQNGSSSGGFLLLTVFLDGKPIGSFASPSSSPGNAGSTTTTPIQFGGFYTADTSDVFETGTVNNHTLTVAASDNCHTPANDHFIVNSVALDVEAFS